MVWQLTKIGFLDLTPEKYDICILIDIVNGGDTGKIYGKSKLRVEKF